MPITTRHYDLEAFTFGDYYSASADQRRFTAIDSQLALISDFVGQGRIDGWDIELQGIGPPITIKVNSGMGVIGRTVYISYGSMSFNMLNNQLKYIFMKKKTDVTGGFSAPSNIESTIASDSTPPASPTGLTQIDALITFEQIAFEWNENSEVDFSHYVVTRLGDAEYGLEDTSTTTTDLSFIDTGLEQDTVYNYEVISVDLSGNQSDPSLISVSTSVDTRQPLAPLFLQVFVGNESVQAIWDLSPSDYVEYYEVQVQLLDNNYNPDGSVITFPLIDANSDDSFGSTYIFIDNLINNRYYKISIRSLSFGGQYSEDIFKIVKPLSNSGAGEARDVKIEFSQSSLENVKIDSELSWSYIEDPYLPSPDQFIITIFENGVRQSEPINVLSSDSQEICGDSEYDKTCYSYDFQFVPYLDSTDGIVKFESLKEYTPYLIQVQTYLENEDVVSGGAFLRINRTPSYDLLPAVTEVNIVRNPSDNSIIANWVNPASQFFSKCKITVSITDLTVVGEEDIIIAEDLDIKKASDYIISGEYFRLNQRYNFTITPIDIFKRAGQDVKVSEQFLGEDINTIPLSPRSQNVSSGDGIVTLVWSSEQDNVVAFNIYKAFGDKIYYRTSDFIKIATLDNDVNIYTDFDAPNSDSYAYYITAVNIYGNESISPNDDYLIPPVLTASPKFSGVLPPPENLTISTSSRDVILNWDFTSGAFDGYEIYKSVGNNYSFELLAQTSAAINSYTDEDALLKDGVEYYYFVRKYRNETVIFVSSSNVSPQDSIILGSVQTFTGSTSPKITDLSTNLKNLETPLENLIEEKVEEHKHNIDEQGNDKRIELRSNSVVTNWSTTDYKTYSTNEDISGAENYLIKVFAEVNELYFTNEQGSINASAIKQAQTGSPPILYILNSELGTITFNMPLYTICEEPENPDPLNPTNICPVRPYLTEPIISIELLGISEIQNELTNEQIEEVNATQIDSGIFADVQIPDVSHEGRIREQLLPVKLAMRSFDNVVYSLTDVYSEDTRNRMGNSVTFYDVIQIVGNDESDENILAATSSGIWFSSDLGNNWINKETFPEAVHRVFQASSKKIYAVTNYNVFVNDGINLSSWIQMAGLQGVKIIRDITEDSLGNLYITTDLGVFRLNKDKPYIEDTWEQLSIFGVKSTEAYGIIYIPEEDAIFTSNQLGILSSNNEGASWSFVSELDITIKVIRFLRRGDYVFALTNDKIYRKEIGVFGFDLIASLENVNLSRQIVIYDDVIYITTDDGIKMSSTNNIYIDVDIDFVSIWSNINEKGNNTIISSLNLVLNRLFVGTDKKIYIFDSDKIWLQYEQQNSIVPTIFINDIEQKLGFYYNNEGEYHNISFYEQNESDDSISISNKYDIYVANSGGWVEQKFDAKVKLWQNRLFHSESTDNISIDQTEFVQFVFPTYDDSNTNEETALEYQVLLQDNLDVLTGLNLPEGDELRNLITDTHNLYQKFISQLYRKSRFIDVQNADGTTTTEVLTFPAINIPLVTKEAIVNVTGDIEFIENSVGATFNVSNGQFNFGQDFEKGDILEIDILGVTVDNAGDLSHRDIEDSLELVNSGLPSVLSQVSQINNVKLGIFTEKKWPNQREDYSPPLQAEYIIPSDTEWYDTLNSTINYEEEVSVDDISLALPYATSVLYVDDDIWIGGKGGILILEIDSLDIRELDALNISEETVRDMMRYGDILYVLTNKAIYKSQDFGISWDEVDRAGLPNNLGAISVIQNNIIVGAEDGIYFRASEFSDWERVLMSQNMVDIFANTGILFTVVDNKIYTSVNGYTYVDSEIEVEGNITQIIKHLSTVYVSTDQGLFNDTGTFYGNDPKLTQIILENKEEQGVNDLYADGVSLWIALSDGSYFEINTEGVVLNEFSDLNTIHKILSINDIRYLIGFDKIKITDIDYPIRLTTGVPV